MSGFHQGDEFSGLPPFVRFTPGPWRIESDDCSRLTDTAPLDQQLLLLLEELSGFCAAWDAVVTLNFEPNGDGCDSGIQVIFVVAADFWRAMINPSPWSRDLKKVNEMHAELTTRGWVCGSDESFLPLDGAIIDETDASELSDRQPFLKFPELWTSPRDGLGSAFVAEVVNVAVEHAGAAESNWFVWDGDLNEPLTMLINSDGEVVSQDWARWTIRLAELLPEKWTTPAVWPSGSEGAMFACRLGNHDRHEGACVDGRLRAPLNEKSPRPVILRSFLRFDDDAPDDFLVDEVRLTDAAGLHEQIRYLFSALSELSSELDVDVEMHLSPTARGQADGCQLMFASLGHLWIVEICSVPAIHGGSIPSELGAVLLDRGWVRPAPETPAGPAAQRRGWGIGFAQQGEPDWRLVCDSSSDDVDEFVERTIWAATNVLGAPPTSWVVGPAVADAARSAELREIAEVWGRGDDWKVALDELLPEGWTTPTIWPSGSPRSIHACFAERHDRHEPPCY
jgi:hypothetical protein